MNRRAAGILVVGLLIAPGTVQANSLESAIRRVIQAGESRVVQLRYFGSGQDALGAAGAPVTGYDLGDGWILTSLYGLEKTPAALICYRAEGNQSPVEVIGRDESRRLALLREKGTESATPPRVPSRPAQVGETVIALGRVYDRQATTTATGIVSAVARLGGRAVQTDALVSPVNYGGPLLGLDGRLLGIISPMAGPGMKGTDLYDSGIGFAIPPSQFNERLALMASGATLRSGWLGAAFTKDDPLRAAPTVLSVVDEGPAAIAGIVEGDVIVSINDDSTASVWALRARLSGLDAEQAIIVRVRRDGQEQDLQVVLSERMELAANGSKK